MSREGVGVAAMSDSDDSWESDTGEDVEVGERTKCLFSDKVMPSSAAALEHDRTHFGFDFEKYTAQVCVFIDLLWEPSLGETRGMSALVFSVAFRCAWMSMMSSNASTTSEQASKQAEILAQSWPAL